MGLATRWSEPSGDLGALESLDDSFQARRLKCACRTCISVGYLLKSALATFLSSVLCFIYPFFPTAVDSVSPSSTLGKHTMSSPCLLFWVFGSLFLFQADMLGVQRLFSLLAVFLSQLLQLNLSRPRNRKENSYRLVTHHGV